MYPHMRMDSLHVNENSVADYPELQTNSICVQVLAVQLDNALHLI